MALSGVVVNDSLVLIDAANRELARIFFHPVHGNFFQDLQWGQRFQDLVGAEQYLAYVGMGDRRDGVSLIAAFFQSFLHCRPLFSHLGQVDLIKQHDLWFLSQGRVEE